MKSNLGIRLYLFLSLALASGACFAQNGRDEVAMDNEAEGDVVTDETHVFAPVFHKVAPGETMESIMKEFGMNKYQFDKWNTLPEGLKPGANVVVKYRWYKRSEYNMNTLQEVNAANKAVKANGNIIYHRVAAHETLFSLASQYHVAVQQLKQWNNLPDNRIKANTNLIVAK